MFEQIIDQLLRMINCVMVGCEEPNFKLYSRLEENRSFFANNIEWFNRFDIMTQPIQAFISKNEESMKFRAFKRVKQHFLCSI